ncbi:hypothetical protein GMLC_31430 [Geomonas limicola]|uniref:Lipoprotein n=1 Tax=Geomonas limicola TaxID=2740186 RepID=A0A6V8NCF2_9BACT|nr:hypothetical protein [Geomonas limicola]GFO69564.1 hypothetical protein GMLC_31430 [Geomonas limicola]
MKNITLLIASLLILVVCASCGGGGGSPGADPQPAPSVNSGPTSKSYLLSLQGSVESGQATGLQFEVTLPAGVELALDSQDQTVLPASLALSASAASGALMQGRVASGVLTVALVSVSGLAKGPFASISATIPAGASAPSASAFRVANLQAIDSNGNPLSGVSVAVVDPP